MNLDSLWESLLDVAARYPRNDIHVFHGQATTYEVFVRRAEKVARGLHALGVREGDRVALLAPNRPEFLELLFACARLGAALVPINSRFGESDLREALRRCGAKVLFHAGQFRKHDYAALVDAVLGSTARERRTHQAVEPLPELERVISLDRGTDPDEFHYEQMLGSGAQLSREGANDKSVGLMIFTSGTSGFPKPVMLTQGQLVRNMRRVREWQGVDQADRVLSFLPYFHVFGGVITVLVPILAGATILILEAFDAGESLQVAHDERCTVVYSVSPCWRAWLDHPNFKDFDLSAVRTGICVANGAAQLPTAMQVRQVFGPMLSLFGMTETHGIATLTCPGDSDALAARTAGVAIPDAQIGIFDPKSDRRLTPGEEGELRVRGDMVSHGYFRMPDETRRAFTEDGWLRTGDLGVIDDQGYLRVLGRLGDRLKSGGENIDPKEVEAFIEGHGNVVRCQVIGVPDARLGQVPVAFVIPREPVPDDAAEGSVRDFCRGKIADFKIPRRVFLVSEFPGFETKVFRHKLRDDAMARMGLIGTPP